MTSQGPADDPAIAAFVAETLESAGAGGLCLEGCLELAVDQLRRRHPEIDRETAWRLVRTVSDEIRAR